MMRQLVAALFLGLAGVFAWWRFYFFLRDPLRVIPPGDSLLAPADGYVVYAKRINEGSVPVAVKGTVNIPLDEYVGMAGPLPPSGWLIGIYMTVLSVHRNRIPASGTVSATVHRAAARNVSMARLMTYLTLRRRPYDEDSEFLLRNARTTIAIDTGRGTVLVTQIADAWISHVIANVRPGDVVRRGEQYGMIRFGSQVDAFFPDSLGMRPTVEVGESVRAGETTIAKDSSPAGALRV